MKALQTVNATVYNKNGAFNLRGLLVSSSQSVSTFTKLNNAFKAYNGNLSKSTQLQNAYVQAVGILIPYIFQFGNQENPFALYKSL